MMNRRRDVAVREKTGIDRGETDEVWSVSGRGEGCGGARAAPGERGAG